MAIWGIIDCIYIQQYYFRQSRKTNIRTVMFWPGISYALHTATQRRRISKFKLDLLVQKLDTANMLWMNANACIVYFRVYAFMQWLFGVHHKTLLISSGENNCGKYAEIRNWYGSECVSRIGIETIYSALVRQSGLHCIHCIYDDA